MDPRDGRRIVQLAQRRHGVLTPEDAERLGIGWRALRRYVLGLGGGSLYRGTVHLPTFSGYLLRCAAACAAVGEGALVAGRSAARCWSINPRAPIPVLVRVPPRAPIPSLAKVAAFRAELSPADRATVDGVPVTAVPRTLLDLARCAGPAELDETVALAVQQRLCDL